MVEENACFDEVEKVMNPQQQVVLIAKGNALRKTIKLKRKLVESLKESEGKLQEELSAAKKKK